MAYDADKMFKGAAALASLGMKVAKIYGLRDNMTCTCEQGASCKTPGKHPVGKDWGERATDDEDVLAGWFDNSTINDNVRWNIGVRLGPASGVIDVEADDEEAMRVMERFGIDQIHTIAYKGSRGPHYLFRYEDDLPSAGVVKVDGLEVRIGGGYQQTQSVFPPSQHGSGAVYDWLPGRSPDDAGIADLPTDFKAAVVAAARGGRSSGAVSRAVEKMIAGEITGEGNRHDFLVGLASELSRRLRHFSEKEKQVNFMLLNCANQVLLLPPKDISEVMKINADQFEFFRSSRDKDRNVRLFERLGMEFTDGEYEPGEWRLTIVHSDPKELRLFIPSDPSKGGGQPWRVSMTVEEAMDAKVAASKIMNSSDVDVQADGRKRWAALWSGYQVEGEDGRPRDVVGMFHKLHAAATHEYPSGDEKAYVTFARNVLTFFNTFTAEIHDEGEKPNGNGFPKSIRHKSGQVFVWFKWSETMQAAFRAANDPQGFTPKRSKDFKLRLLTSLNLPHVDRAFPGLVGRYTQWSEVHMEKLREMASE